MPPFRDVDEAYDRLRVTGQNSVENIVQWLKDAQVLEMLQKTEEDAKRLFENVRDKRNVTKEQFREFLRRIAAENDQTIEELSSLLVNTGIKLFKAFNDAAKAFEASLTAPGPSCSTNYFPFRCPSCRTPIPLSALSREGLSSSTRLQAHSGTRTNSSSGKIKGLTSATKCECQSVTKDAPAKNVGKNNNDGQSTAKVNDQSSPSKTEYPKRRSKNDDLCPALRNYNQSSTPKTGHLELPVLELPDQPRPAEPPRPECNMTSSMMQKLLTQLDNLEQYLTEEMSRFAEQSQVLNGVPFCQSSQPVAESNPKPRQPRCQHTCCRVRRQNLERERLETATTSPTRLPDRNATSSQTSQTNGSRTKNKLKKSYRSL